VFRFYFRHILPRIGALVSGNAGAYTYLPESVLAFPDPERLAGLMRATGFRTRFKLLSGGIAAIHVGDKG
jgi:demethylmenaquinone methyltransferase/2-methoxy-6-polyprenyl-1,4-benzoquinol methylase